MRILLCGVAAIALSGCSWVGLGGSHGKTVTKHNGGQYAQNCVGCNSLSKWNLEGGIGPEFVVGGKAITGSNAASNQPGFISGGVPTTTNNVSMKDAYKTGYRAALGGSYALNPNRKISAEAYYTGAKGKDITFANQDGVNIRGKMSNYEAFGMEAGLRQYFGVSNAPVVKSIRPYVEGKLGAARVNDIALENIRGVAPTDARTPTALRMYDASWVPTAAGLVGVETIVADRFTMGLETGVRFTGSPQSENGDLGLNAPAFNRRYAGFNDGGSRTTIPLTIRGRYRF